jgi:hypothetical protein
MLISDGVMVGMLSILCLNGGNVLVDGDGKAVVEVGDIRGVHVGDEVGANVFMLI